MMHYTLRQTLAGIVAAFLCAGAVATFGSGCATAADLGRVPDARASLEERADAYDRLRPRAALQTRMATWGARQDLVLNGGVVVENASDLQHVVATGSNTAVHAQRAADDEMLSDVMFGAGAVLATVAVSACAAELIALAAPPPRGSVVAQAMPAVGFTGLGAGITAGVAMLPAGLAAVAAARERNAAYAAYDADLRTRLALVPKNDPHAREQLAAQWEE